MRNSCEIIWQTYNICSFYELANWFGKESVDCLLADREFVGGKWLAFLNQNNIWYYIRIRNNFKIYSYQKQEEIKAFWLFNNLKTGNFYHYPKTLSFRE